MNTSPWWNHRTPARTVSKTAQEQARDIPARYHLQGAYHTNDPDTPLWKATLRAIRGACEPSVFIQKPGQWCFEYIVLINPDIVHRLLGVLVKHRPQNRCLRHHLATSTKLTISDA